LDLTDKFTNNDDVFKWRTIISLPLVSFLVGSIFVSPDYKHSSDYDA